MRSTTPTRTFGRYAFSLAALATALFTHGSPSALPTSAPPPNGNGGVIQSCGPDTYEYCYGNNWDSTITYQGVNAFPIAIVFNSGNMESCCDNITIHDGLDATGPVLFSGNNGGSLAGIFAASTNADHAITVVFHSDVSVNCSDGSWGFQPLNWTVSCLDCTAPLATFDVDLDCTNSVFYAVVNISAMGTDPATDITNNAGAPMVTATAPGTYNIGPFPLGTQVVVTLENDLNPLCNVHSPTLTNAPCPFISCGPDTYDYCYPNSDQSMFIYQSSDTQPIGLLFNSGGMDVFGDNITIYNGLNQFAPVLYSGFGNNGDLSGLLFTSNNPDNALALALNMNTFSSCQDGSTTPWNYIVSCYDGCVPPVATYDVVLDCANSQYFIQTSITNMGTANAITITNTGGAPDVIATATGDYLSGPFANGTSQSVALSTGSVLCGVHSGQLINGPCPYISCGPDHYTYCYGNNWDSTTVYQSASTFPIAILFNSGNMESCCDRITVYDGLNTFANMIYQGNGNLGDMTGLFFASTNPDNALTVVWHSDGSINCSDGTWGFATLDWTVSCLDCVNPAASFEVIPDCTHHGYQVAVNVTNTGGTMLNLVNSYQQDTTFNVGAGVTILGPIPVDTLAHITVLNGLNPLCKIVSPDLFYGSDSCIITSCVPSGTEYCYQNSDTAWFTYTSGTSDPITITFGWGQLLVDDYIQIYNGPDTSAQLVYMGNPGGNLAGLAINSSNPANALTLLVISNGAGACATGQAVPMYWSVGCGLVGINDPARTEVGVFPNPASDAVYIRLPESMMLPLQVDLLDVAGRLVRSERFTSRGDGTVRASLADVPNGNYSLVLSTASMRKATGLQVVR